MRVWIESIMSISLSQRDYAGRMVINTREIIDWLWPNGTFRPVRHMEHLNRALTAVNNSLIPWRGGYWAAVLVRNYPGTPDDEIVMEIELPPGSGRGPLVHRVVLRRYGVQSVALYRAYLAAAYMWDEFGTHAGKVIQATRPSVLRDAEGSLLDSKGRKIADRDGRPVRRWSHPKAVPLGEREPNPAASRYPVLSEYDLMRMVNATGTDHSRAAKIAARKAFEKMAEDEVITLESGLVSPKLEFRLTCRQPPDPGGKRRNTNPRETPQPQRWAFRQATPEGPAGMKSKSTAPTTSGGKEQTRAKNRMCHYPTPDPLRHTDSPPRARIAGATILRGLKSDQLLTHAKAGLSLPEAERGCATNLRKRRS